MKAPIFYWDEEKGIARCILSDGKKEFIGYAYCAEDDNDMKSHLTGEEIAFHRAKIEYYVHVRDNELLPQLRILEQMYYSMYHSPRFNPNSYESKTLKKYISIKKDELEIIRNMIKLTKKDLKEYLDAKDRLFKIMRRNRKEDEMAKMHQ